MHGAGRAGEKPKSSQVFVRQGACRDNDEIMPITIQHTAMAAHDNLKAKVTEYFR